MSQEPDIPGPWPKKGDQLIGANGSRHLNAWIAGNTDLIAHIEGYKRAADLIYTRIDENPRLAGIAYLVFPVVYLYRHFVELSIKDVIALGSYLESVSDGVMS